MATGFVAIQDVEVVCERDNDTITKATAPETKTNKVLEGKIKNLDKSQREKKSRMIDKL